MLSTAWLVCRIFKSIWRERPPCLIFYITLQNTAPPSPPLRASWLCHQIEIAPGPASPSKRLKHEKKKTLILCLQPLSHTYAPCSRLRTLRASCRVHRGRSDPEATMTPAEASIRCFGTTQPVAISADHPIDRVIAPHYFSFSPLRPVSASFLCTAYPRAQRCGLLNPAQDD